MRARPILFLSLFAAGCGGGLVSSDEGQPAQRFDEEWVEGEALVDALEGDLRACVTVGSKLVTTAAINFRTAPSTEATKLGVLPRNATVTVMGACPEPGYYSYFNVSYEGTVGWAAGRYLRSASDTAQNAPVEPAPQPPVEGILGVLDVPYISQYRPSGADADYINGDSNCGPTSMAMIGRYYGYGPERTDAELVTHLNLADGRPTGATSADGIKQMAALLGKPVVHQLGPDLVFVERSLAEGKPVAARGIFSSVRHYIVVTGKNEQGDFTVNDPASSSRKTVSPEQLSAFIRRHPEGAFFSIG